MKNARKHEIWVRGSQVMVRNHSMDTRTIWEYFGHTRASNFQTNENLGLQSFFHGLSTIKQCDFNQKTSILDPWFTSYAPKHPNFAGLGQKWVWPITSQGTTF